MQPIPATSTEALDLAYDGPLAASVGVISHLAEQPALRVLSTRGKPNFINRETSEDLVNRDGPNLLWMTDITEHKTKEGKLYQLGSGPLGSRFLPCTYRLTWR